MGYGYKIILEDEFHWILAKGDKDDPIPIPKQPGVDGCVSIDVMESALISAGIDNYTYYVLKTTILEGKTLPES